MFDYGNAAFAYQDNADVEPYVSSHLTVVDKREKEEFAVSIIEQGTRLISRGSLNMAKAWATSQHIHVGRKKSAGLGGHPNKEFIRRAWAQKLNTRAIKSHGQQNLIVDDIVINLALSPESLSQALERATQMLSPEYDYLQLPEAQTALPLVGDFSPSRKLVEFWARGVSSHRPKNIGRVPEGRVQISAQIQAEFAKMLQAVLATSGQQRRYGVDREVDLTVGGRFVTSMQSELCERFQIVPDEAGAFLTQLYSELRSSLSEGASIRGAWGHIRLTADHNLTYQLSEAVFAEDSSFVMSEDVE